MSELGRRLRALREQKGWTQTEVARRINIDRAYLSRMEHGKHPSPPVSTVLRLAQLLGVSVEYLTGETDDATPPNPIKFQDPDVAFLMAELKFLAPEDVYLVRGIVRCLRRMREKLEGK